MSVEQPWGKILPFLKQLPSWQSTTLSRHTSLIGIVVGGRARLWPRFDHLVITPVRPRRCKLNRLAIITAWSRAYHLIVIARAELLDAEKAPGAGTPAKEPRLGRTGQHEHRCAYQENLFHGAPFSFEPNPVEFGGSPIRVLTRNVPGSSLYTALVWLL